MVGWPDTFGAVVKGKIMMEEICSLMTVGKQRELESQYSL
jgi:hypothetical protein